MTVEFEKHALQWREHVAATSHLSVGAAALRHPSFEALVALGDEVIPLAFEAWVSDELTPWGAVLVRVTGLSEMGDGLRGDRVEMRRRWFAWRRR